MDSTRPNHRWLEVFCRPNILFYCCERVFWVHHLWHNYEIPFLIWNNSPEFLTVPKLWTYRNWREAIFQLALPINIISSCAGKKQVVVWRTSISFCPFSCFYLRASYDMLSEPRHQLTKNKFYITNGWPGSKVLSYILEPLTVATQSEMECELALFFRD